MFYFNLYRRNKVHFQTASCVYKCLKYATSFAFFHRFINVCAQGRIHTDFMGLQESGMGILRVLL